MIDALRPLAMRIFRHSEMVSKIYRDYPLDIGYIVYMSYLYIHTVNE